MHISDQWIWYIFSYGIFPIFSHQILTTLHIVLLSIGGGGGGWAIIFFGMRSPKYTGGHKFLERKIGGGGHKIFDNLNVGIHKMTTDSVFILFKKNDFNTILACLGGKVYLRSGVIKFCPQNRGVEVLSMPTFAKFGTPLLKKMIAP